MPYKWGGGKRAAQTSHQWTAQLCHPTPTIDSQLEFIGHTNLSPRLTQRGFGNYRSSYLSPGWGR